MLRFCHCFLYQVEWVESNADKISGERISKIQRAQRKLEKDGPCQQNKTKQNKTKTRQSRSKENRWCFLLRYISVSLTSKLRTPFFWASFYSLRWQKRCHSPVCLAQTSQLDWAPLWSGTVPRTKLLDTDSSFPGPHTYVSHVTLSCVEWFRVLISGVWHDSWLTNVCVMPPTHTCVSHITLMCVEWFRVLMSGGGVTYSWCRVRTT